ncbi:MAG: SRPBCC domain-containing protein [Phycisphaerales bacterium]
MPNASSVGSSASPKSYAARAPQQVFRTVIRGSIEAVWSEITRTDEPMPCFFNMRMHVDGQRVGSRLRMRTPNGKYTGVVGDILVWEPPHRFSHTFRFTQYDDAPCRVTYELREHPEGVEFTLMLDDLPAGTKTAKQMTQGAALIVATLKATVEGTTIPFMMRFIHVVSKLTQPLTPKRCASSNWP